MSLYAVQLSVWHVFFNGCLEFLMIRKLIFFAITSGLAAKLVKSYMAKQKGQLGTSAVPVAARPTAPRYTRRAD